MNIRQKCRRHDETIKTSRPVVFCARCGSTRIDQNSVVELVCYDCGNSAPWDATRFSIRRGLSDIGAGDVLRGLENAVSPRTEGFVRAATPGYVPPVDNEDF